METEDNLTPEKIMYKHFQVKDKIGMMKEQFIGLGAQSSIIEAMQSYADQELASLREQLKQKEEVIRELIPIAEVGQAYYRQNPGFNWAAEREKSKAIIKQEQIYELVKRKDILFLEVKQVNQDLLKALEMLLDHVTEDTMNTNWSDVIKLTKDAIAKSKNIKS